DGTEYSIEDIRGFVEDSLRATSTAIHRDEERQSEGKGEETLAQELGGALTGIERELMSKSHDARWVSETISPLKELKLKMLQQIQQREHFMALLNNGVRSFKVKKAGEIKVKHEIDIKTGTGRCIGIMDDGKPIGTIPFKLNPGKRR
ncbi:MAG: hypothetical protein ACRECH_18030, partial [Nitrososphaerales archaeon]